MKIGVLVKQVPDSWAEKRLNSEQRLERQNVELVLNELDEYAIEAALVLAETGGEVEAISVGPESAGEAVRRALAMGVDSGVLLTDDAIAGADYLATSKVLAALIKAKSYDLVIAGVESTDARGGVIPAMVAANLGWPALTYSRELTLDAGTISGERLVEHSVMRLSCSLPAVVSVVEKANTPRFPTLKGVLAAKKKPFEALSLADIGLSAGEIATQSIVTHSEVLPPRSRGELVDGEVGQSAQALLEFLMARKLV